jgi:hypothetical protein
MSWDLMACKVPPEFKSTKDLPKHGWEPQPFSLRTEVKTRLGEMLPGIRFKVQEPTGTLWGTYIGDGFSLEISLGATEEIVYLWIAVRGDMKALSMIAEIVETFALRGVDLQRGEFFDAEEARKSFGEWRAAVDQFREEKL